MSLITEQTISPVNHFEQLIQQSFTLPFSERSYMLSYIQSSILDTLPDIHNLSDTKRLIILYKFIDSTIARYKQY